MGNLENLKKAQQKRRADKERKEKNTIDVIKGMVEANEPVTVKELEKRTGFSVSYFWNDEAVKKALLDAQEFQNRKRMPMPKQDVENQTADQQLISLARQNERLRMEVAILRRENKDLKEQQKEQEEQLRKREGSLAQQL